MGKSSCLSWTYLGATTVALTLFSPTTLARDLRGKSNDWRRWRTEDHSGSLPWIVKGISKFRTHRHNSLFAFSSTDVQIICHERAYSYP